MSADSMSWVFNLSVMPIPQAGKERASSATGSAGLNTTRPAWFLPCRGAPVSNRTSRCPLGLRTNSLMVARKGGLLNDSENLFRLDGLTRGNFQFFQDTISGRYDRNFHLHRFHNHHDFVFLHLITDFFFNPQDLTHHGRLDVYCQCSAPFSLMHRFGYVIRVLPFSRVSQCLSMLAWINRLGKRWWPSQQSNARKVWGNRSACLVARQLLPCFCKFDTV